MRDHPECPIERTIEAWLSYQKSIGVAAASQIKTDQPLITFVSVEAIFWRETNGVQAAILGGAHTTSATRRLSCQTSAAGK